MPVIDALGQKVFDKRDKNPCVKSLDVTILKVDEESSKERELTYGQKPMACGTDCVWSVANGCKPVSAARGPRPVTRSQWNMTRDLWPVVCGLWPPCMAHGPRPVADVLLPMAIAHGPWPMAHCPWPVAHCPLRMAHGPLPMAYGEPKEEGRAFKLDDFGHLLRGIHAPNPVL